MEYGLLVEHEWLMGARELDARYHQAKLFGLMMTNEGAEYAFQEHQQLRAAMLNGATVTSPEMSREQLLEAVTRIHRKLQQAGLRNPDSGAIH